jgi:hypothetical protein
MKYKVGRPSSTCRETRDAYEYLENTFGRDYSGCLDLGCKIWEAILQLFPSTTSLMCTIPEADVAFCTRSAAATFTSVSCERRLRISREECLSRAAILSKNSWVNTGRWLFVSCPLTGQHFVLLLYWQDSKQNSLWETRNPDTSFEIFSHTLSFSLSLSLYGFTALSTLAAFAIS